MANKNIKLHIYLWQIEIIPHQGPGTQAKGGGTQVTFQQQLDFCICF